MDKVKHPKDSTLQVGFPKNFRAYIIGSSETGKTYQIVKLLKRRVLDYNNVWVISNNESTLNQPLYSFVNKDRKIMLKGIVQKPKFEKGDFIIIDDIDSFPKNSWLSTLATVESHHSDVSVVYICHKWKTGNVELRGSVEFIFLFDNPEDIMTSIIKELGINEEDQKNIAGILNNPKGIKPKKNIPNAFKNHNHVLYDRRYPFIKTDKELIKRSRLATYDVSGKYNYL